jgi:hypothetical protein
MWPFSVSVTFDRKQPNRLVAATISAGLNRRLPARRGDAEQAKGQERQRSNIYIG